VKDQYLSHNVFISVNRASELSDYSSDYLSQLCRKKSLYCKQISKLWFINLADLHSHIKKSSKEIELDKISERDLVELKESLDKETKIYISSEEYLDTETAARLSGYSRDYIGQLARDGELKAKKLGKVWFVSKKSIQEHKRTEEKRRNKNSEEVQEDSLSYKKEDIIESLPTIHKEETVDILDQDNLVDLSDKSARRDDAIGSVSIQEPEEISISRLTEEESNPINSTDSKKLKIKRIYTAEEDENTDESEILSISEDNNLENEDRYETPSANNAYSTIKTINLDLSKESKNKEKTVKSVEETENSHKIHGFLYYLNYFILFSNIVLIFYSILLYLEILEIPSKLILV
jgi:hypothetical protein